MEKEEDFDELMVDPRKWRSILVRREYGHLLDELAEFQRRPRSTILAELIQGLWDKTFLRKPEIKSDYRKNPFLPKGPTNS